MFTLRFHVGKCFYCILWKELVTKLFIWLPAVCWWYLCFFTLPEHLEVLQNLLNGRHATMSFTIENEMQNRMSFSDVQIIWHYRYLPLPSTVNPPLVEFIHILTPFYHLSISLVMFTHAYRSFRICYPQNFINICPKRFMDNLYVVKETTLAVEKKAFCTSPYIPCFNIIRN